MFKIQFVHGRIPWGVAPGDLPWEDIPGHDNYPTELEAAKAALEYDAAFDGAYTHRVAPVKSEAA